MYKKYIGGVYINLYDYISCSHNINVYNVYNIYNIYNLYNIYNTCILIIHYVMQTCSSLTSQNIVWEYHFDECYCKIL